MIDTDLQKYCVKQYIIHTTRASNLGRCIVGAMSIFCLAYYKNLPTAILMYWTLDLLQYVVCTIRFELGFKNMLNLTKGNMVATCASYLFYFKMVIIFYLLWT